EAVRSIEGTERLIGDAIAASRSLTLELSPPVLYDAGLAPALQWLARKMLQDHGLAMSLELSGNVAPSSDLRLAMFRAARQLMQNVARDGGISAFIGLRIADESR